MTNPIGGLSSGIDTLALLDEMMRAASLPLDNLENKRGILEMKKGTFNEVNDRLESFKRALLALKLETTFKSKNVTSSDDTKITGTATTEAAAGAHTINVSQLATSASAMSLYTNSVLVTNPPNSAGLTSVNGRSDEKIEGEYAVTISDQGSYYQATAVFSPKEGGTMPTATGTTSGVESANLQGTIANSIVTGVSDGLSLTVGSDSISITLDAATADQTMMSEIAVDIEDKINTSLNVAHNTSDITYVVVRRTGNAGATNNDGFVLYSTKNETISVTGGTAQANLGLSTTTASNSQTISNSVSANNLSALLGNMNDGVRGLIRGVTFVATTALTTGTAGIDISSELNIVGGTPTYAYGGLDVATGASLNTTISGLNNAGFTTTITGTTDAATSITSGSFTINGITMSISNYATATVNDVIGIINSSAAGVTATYDSTTDSFTIESNHDGSTSISLGATGDTSNILEAAKLLYSSGATLSYGNTKGAISKSATLSGAGFSRSPSSGTFSINGTTLYVDASSDTIETLISKINNSGANVIAAYDSVTDKFSLSSDQDAVTTNTNNIAIGAMTDTSNILNILNLQNDFNVTMTGTALAGNRAADSLLIAPPVGAALNLSVPATSGSGAWQASPGSVNWIDGIKDGGTFSVLAGTAGNIAYTWTNNSGSTISDVDTFVSEWNKTSNWSSGNAEVRAIKESDTELRFYTRSQAATATFTITANSAHDLYELGLVTAPPSELSATTNTPEAVWHFGENTGTNVADATSNSNDGTISGATWVEGDFFDYSLDFDGTDDYVSVTGSASLNLSSSPMTVEAWIQPDNYGGGTATVFDKTGVSITIDNTGKVNATFATDAVSGTVSTTAQLPATFSGEFYHIAVTYDGVNNTTIYINGTDYTDGATNTVTGNIVDDLTDTLIGNDTAGGGGNPFDGQIDEIGVYNTVITPDHLNSSRQVTISNGANATASAQYNALTLAYAFNSDSSTGITGTTDSSGGITLTSTSLGYYGDFGIADDTGTTVSDYFGSTIMTGTAPTDVSIGTAGEDAYFTVDGVNYIRTTNLVDDVIGGVDLTLRNTFSGNAILNIDVDTEMALTKLVDFIVEYNRTLEKLNPPQLSSFQKGYLQKLSDDEEAAMSATEKEIYTTMYEKYHGYKFIQGESSFRRLYENLRVTSTGDVTGLPDAFNSITDINIKPGLFGTTEDARKGFLIAAPTSADDVEYKAYIRESLNDNYTLKNALAYNSEDVYNLFANDSSVSGGSDGMARVLTTAVESYINSGGILDEQIKIYGAIDKDIILLDKQIVRWESRLEKKEEYYWKKFMAMENAIASLSRQGDQLSSMLANMPAT